MSDCLFSKCKICHRVRGQQSTAGLIQKVNCSSHTYGQFRISSTSTATREKQHRHGENTLHSGGFKPTTFLLQLTTTPPRCRENSTFSSKNRLPLVLYWEQMVLAYCLKNRVQNDKSFSTHTKLQNHLNNNTNHSH